MWADYLETVSRVLAGMSVTGDEGMVLPGEEGFSRWVTWATCLSPKGSIHLVGNGASASMASHFAADIAKNCGIRANIFTDGALITALGNDNGFENAYAVALERYASPGDMLVAISSSGRSANIVNACRMAQRLKVNIVTVTAKDGDNPVRRLGGLNFYVSAATYSLAESAHAVILHHWTDRLEKAYRERI